MNRFCSIKLCDSVGTSFLLICVYLPTDFQSFFTDYLNTLGELEGFIDSQSFDHILISGDFNVDFDRGGDNVQLLCKFMDDYSLVAADLNFRSAIHFTYERDDCAVPSWPDRIICSMSLVNLVSKFDQGVNLSGHYLFRFNFKFLCDTSPSPRSPLPSFMSTSRTSRFDWARASSLDIHNYHASVLYHCPQLCEAVVSCCNPHCCEHYSALDQFCDQLSACLYESGSFCFPTVLCTPNSTCLAGWNDCAKLLKCHANFWHKIWCEAGCPPTGIITQIKKAAKSRFKYEVHILKNVKYT